MLNSVNLLDQSEIEENLIRLSLSDIDRNYIQLSKNMQLIDRIIYKENDKLIGFVSIYIYKENSVHMVYAVNSFYHGKGYGKILINLAIKKAKELGYQCLLYLCDKENYKSLRVIKNHKWFYLYRETKFDIHYLCELDRVNLNNL